MSVKSFFDKLETGIDGFWHDDFVPWFKSLLKNVAHAEVQALLPLASQAAAALGAELATNAGNLPAFAETAKKILRETAAQAEQQAIKASGSALLTAVTTAIVAHAAAVPLGGDAPPDLPPAQVQPTADELAAVGKNPDGSLMDEDALAALGRNSDGSLMSAKERKKAGLPPLDPAA